MVIIKSIQYKKASDLYHWLFCAYSHCLLSLLTLIFTLLWLTNHPILVNNLDA